MTEAILVALLVVLFLAGRDYHRFVRKYKPAWNGPITINNNAPSVAYPDYEVSTPVGMYPQEDDVKEFLNGYGEIEEESLFNPMRGWKVFDGDEEKD